MKQNVCKYQNKRVPVEGIRLALGGWAEVAGPPGVVAEPECHRLLHELVPQEPVGVAQAVGGLGGARVQQQAHRLDSGGAHHDDIATDPVLPFGG